MTLQNHKITTEFIVSQRWSSKLRKRKLGGKKSNAALGLSQKTRKIKTFEHKQPSCTTYFESSSSVKSRF